jgi:signal peptidase I
MNTLGTMARAMRRALPLVLPAPLALLTYRLLVPGSAATLERAFVLARLGAAYPVVLVAALCLLFASLLAYWNDALFVARVPAPRSHPAAASRGAAVWFALSLVGAVGAAQLTRQLLLAPVQVQGASMLPTLESNDLVLVDKRAYGFTKAALPERGDVVVFDRAAGNETEALVKRVVGLPGDRIEMRSGRPVINGWQVPSCDVGTYTYALVDGAVHGRLLVEFLGERQYLTLLTANTRDLPRPFVVPAGEVFVLGDNRNESTDSRTLATGQPAGVPVLHINGRARWFLLGSRRDGSSDVSRLLDGLDAGLHLEGVDTTELRAGIQRCLATRPAQTHPPRADAAG